MMAYETVIFICSSGVRLLHICTTYKKSITYLDLTVAMPLCVTHFWRLQHAQVCLTTGEWYHCSGSWWGTK